MTLRELIRMAEARIRQEWNHTSAVLAMLANCHRDPKKSRTFRPADFHPLTRDTARRGELPRASIMLLKTIFVDQQRRPDAAPED